MEIIPGCVLYRNMTNIGVIKSNHVTKHFVKNGRQTRCCVWETFSGCRTFVQSAVKQKAPFVRQPPVYIWLSSGGKSSVRLMSAEYNKPDFAFNIKF